MQPSPTESTNRITVYIDADLKQIVPTFLSNRRKDVETLRSALLGKDFDTIRTLGHRMKGDGGGYGFDRVTEIGGVMESAAIRHDHPALERQITELEDFLSRVQVEYR